MKKKRFAQFLLIAAAAFMIPCCGFAAESEVQNRGDIPFRDVAVHWAEDDITYAYSHDLISGTSAQTFSPNDFITRGQFTAILYRMAGQPKTEGSVVSFTDVRAGKYYFDAVQWASENNLIFGRTFSQFCPDDYVPREELAEILHRYFFYDQRVNHPDMPSVSLIYPDYPEKYTDTGDVSEFADRGMRWAVGLANIISGKTAATLNPKDHATRAEAVSIVHRFLNSIES